MKPSNVIYLITNLVNGKRYVGQTVSIQSRWKAHQKESRNGNQRPLYRAMRKYGLVNFVIEELGQYPDTKSLNEAESYWIRYYQSETPLGYNLTSGGDRGWSVTGEVRRKLTLSHGGLTEDQELEVVQKYKLGFGSIQLSDEYGVRASTILNILERHRCQRRTQSESKGGLPRELEPEVILEYSNGNNASQVGREYGVSYVVILGVLRRNKFPVKSISLSNGGLPVEQESCVVHDYMEGMSAPQVGAKYGVSKTTILSILERHGVRRRDNVEARGGLPREQESKVVREYLEGESAIQLGARYGVSNVTISNILERNGCRKRTLREARGGLTEDQSLQVLQEYQLGSSTVELAAKYEVTDSCISSILKRYGCPRRGHGKASRQLSQLSAQ